MVRVYISSTYADLKQHREEAYRALRQVRYDVVGMEDYVAADRRAPAVCLDDVAQCEIYVGIFAWRYGYVPDHDNPARKSITELELIKARETGKTCLIFLLHEEEPWPPAHIERGKGGEKVQALRAELCSQHTVDFFRTKDDLARRILAAVHMARLAPPASDTPQSVSGPVAGRLVSKLCNRERQEEEFHDFFTSNLKSRPGLTQFVAVHGDEGECHDSLVERLVVTRVKEVAKKLWGTQNSVVVHKKVGWPYEGDFLERQLELQRKLFSEFEPAHMAGEDRTSTALARLLSLSLSSIVVLQHRINAARWDDGTEKLIRWYTDYWAALEISLSQPQFLVFITLIYPSRKDKSWWRSLVGAKCFDKQRVRDRLSNLASTAHGLGLPFLTLKELEPIHPDDIHEWFSRFNICGEKERHEYSDEMFTTKDGRLVDCISMKDVEHRLQEIHDSYLIRNGYLPAGSTGRALAGL